MKNYIVFDLEWNQCPFGKDREIRTLPFEVIEIGAVKLNDKKEEISRFRELVRPKAYTSLHFKTKEIISLCEQDLDSARSFPEVFADFISWCGEQPLYCTWGPGDLLELQRNIRYHGLENPFPKPLFFYDIQKIFSIVYEDRKSRRTLEHAIDFLNLPKEDNFHSALDDAGYTAAVLEHIDTEDILRNYSVDYYHTPQTRKEEIYVVFDTYSKFVSKGFTSKTEAMKDRKVTSTRCYLCNQAAKRKIRWFTSGGKNYFSLSYCEEHGWLKGKIRIKKSEDGKYFCVKTLKLITAQEAQEICAKKESAHMKKLLKKN